MISLEPAQILAPGRRARRGDVVLVHVAVAAVQLDEASITPLHLGDHHLASAASTADELALACARTALSRNARITSTSVAIWAMRDWLTWKDPIGWPNALRSLA